MHELRRGGKKIVLNYDIIRMHYANNTSLHSDLLVPNKKSRRQKFKTVQKCSKQFCDCNMSGGLRNIRLCIL